MELLEAIRDLTRQKVDRLVLSRPVNRETNPYKRATVRPVLIKGALHYQIERFTDKQAFHENLLPEQLPAALTQLLTQEFSELNGWTREGTAYLRISKKGKVLYRFRKSEVYPTPEADQAEAEFLSLSIPATGGKEDEADTHRVLPQNRQKNYLLNPQDMARPLVDLGVITKDGKIAHDYYDKFRQINRFVEIVAEGLGAEDKQLNIIDFGCGKSYLTFVLYDYLTRVKGIQVTMVGLDLKEEVIRKCNAIAKAYNYDHLTFEVGDINGYEPGFPVDMVISLHACDTATDFALYNAITWGTKRIYSVPCCQHEVNGQLSKDSLGVLTQSGLLKERFAAILTDGIRQDLLTAAGYKTDTLEFVDMAYSPKNVMLRAVKPEKGPLPRKVRKEALERVRSAIETYQVTPTLYQLLQEILQF